MRFTSSNFGRESSVRRCRTLRVLAAAGIGVAVLPNFGRADVTATWIGGSGNWTAAADWSTNPNYPNNGTPTGTNYEADITVPGSGAYTVTENGTVSVDSLVITSSNATLSDTGGTLSVGSANITSGTFQLAGGTLSGGSTGATIKLDSPSNFQLASGTLNNLTFAGSNLNFSQSGVVEITGGLNLSGSALNLTASGETLIFDGPSQTIDDLSIDSTAPTQSMLYVGGTHSPFNPTLTVGSNGTIHGSLSINNGNYSSTTLVNNGVTDADLSTQTLAVNTYAFTNNATAEATNGGVLLINATTWTNASTGTITANGATINLGGAWTNAGSISAVNGATINLGGTFTPASLTSITASSNSAINLTGTLNNSGGTLTFSSSPGLDLTGGTISGGNVNFGSNLNIISGTLNGVTVPSGGSINVTAGGTLNLAGSWNNQGTIATSANSTLNLGGTFTSAAIGTINADPSSALNITGTINNAGGTLALNNSTGSFVLAGGSIVSGTIATGYSLLVSAGVIGAATIAPGTTIGLLSAGSLTLVGSWSNQGTISVAVNSTLNLGGTFTPSAIGAINAVPGANVNITGMLNNAGNTLTFPGTAPIWNLNGGTISGGNVAFGSNLNTINGTLSGVTVPVGYSINVSAGGTVTLNGSWNNQGSITTSSNSTLNLGGQFTVAEIGTISADPSSTVNITGYLDNTGNTLTLAGVTSPWNLKGGQISNGILATGSNLDVVNGTLQNITIPAGGSVDVAPGGTASLVSPLNNQGVINLSANSTLNLSSGLTPQMIGTINGPANSTVYASEFNNTNNTLTLNSSTPLWNVGEISGGTIVIGNGGNLNIGTSTLDGVTLQGSSPNAANFQSLTVTDGLTGSGQNFNIGGASGYIPAVYFASPAQQLTNINIDKNNATGASIVTCFVGPLSGMTAYTLTVAPNAGLTATTGRLELEGIDNTGSTIVNNGVVSANGPTGTLQMSFLALFTNNGTLGATNGGTVYVDSTSGLINNGLIYANGGALDLTTNTFQNARGASIDATNHSTVTLSSYYETGANYGTITLDDSTGTISGSWYNSPNSAINIINGGTLHYLSNPGPVFAGTINLLGGNVIINTGAGDGLSMYGTVSGSGSISGDLAIKGSFDFHVGGTMQGVTYDSYVSPNGALYLDGSLAVTLTNGFASSITSSEQFTLASGFGGSFTNVSNGGRLETTDGSGSFQVNFGTGQYVGELVLTDFLPTAEPWTNATGNNLWDTGVSANFSANSSPTVFHTGDVVTFNDSNNNGYNVTINTAVTPGAVVVNNSAGNYTFSGGGGIAGAGALFKFGSSTLTLNTANSYTGGTNVSAGTVIAGVAGAIPNGPVNIANGTLQLAAGIGLTQITSLSIAGNGTFDITNNHVIINYGSGSDSIASIAAYLASGYAGGSWNGAGIMTSAPLVVGGLSYGLGYADSADAGNPAGLPSGEIEIKYTLLGDADLSGVVDGTDFGIVAANFNKGVTGWDQGDFNYDNVVDGTDFGDLAANFNKGASGASVGVPAIDDAAIVAFAQANGLMADLPDPGCVPIALLMAAGALSRRRQRRSARRPRAGNLESAGEV